MPLFAAVLIALFTAAPAAAGDISVRITSPLGRTGTPGTIRIVAQVKPQKGQTVSEVRFSVDGKPQGSVTAGPPYSVEWTDSNPFERRVIVVEAKGTDGEVGRDQVVLDPYELSEITEVTSVLVDAAIYDKAGRPVKGMTASDFVLEEDGKPQKPDLVAQEAIPTTFAVLVDGSQSMSRNIDFVQEAAGRLATYLRPRDRVIVAPFSLRLRAITGPTNDRRTIAEAVQAITAEGGTALRDSMIDLAGRLSTTPGRRVIILITDGYDENSRASLEDAVTAVKAQGITVYCVGIGGVAGISLKSHNELKQIASATNGKYFFPSRPDQLPDVYDVLASDAQLRYLISYTPANQRRDGTWRTIAVRPHAPDLMVKARPGYFAPKPPPVKPALEFTAMDLQSRFLEVTKDDLIVVEDGVEQKIDTFQEATTPVMMVLALDQSGSMKRSADQVVEAATAFVGALRPEDWLGVITFADRSMVAHGMTQERESTLQAIAAYRGRRRHGALRRPVRLGPDAEAVHGPQGRGRADRRPRRGQPGHGAGQHPHVGAGDRPVPRGRRHRVRRRPRHQDRSGAPDGARHGVRGPGLLPPGGRRVVRAVRAHRRQPQPPVCHWLHFHQLVARRQMANGGN